MELEEKAIKLILDSVITCPSCGHQEKETMPVNSCECYYDCVDCNETLEPRGGECCVYCAYGSTPCPATQEGKEGRSC